MNPLTILSLIPTILRIVEFVKGVLGQGLSINSIGKIVQNDDVRSVFEELGKTLFPNVKPELQASAAMVASYSPEYVKKVQNAANVLLAPSPNLDVDGHYGALTQAAVVNLQKQLKMPVVDGWVGDNTMAAIQAALVKHDEAAKTNVPTPEIPKT